MFRSFLGAFDGNSWEALCQQVFKRKYQSEQYQEIPASPGDFGLEGVTLLSGTGFQCYCPDKHYTRAELYEAQRDKITQDLNKLRKNASEISRILGGSKLNTWIFVTPEIDKHALLLHARAKEEEVRQWNLPFISPDFRVLLYDGNDYVVEINQIRTAAGEALNFDDSAPAFAPLSDQTELYENNIFRKSEARLLPKVSSPLYGSLLERLHNASVQSFLEADGYFRRIEATSPPLYARLVRLINEYEKHVGEVATTWTGSAESLTVEVRDGLESRILLELAPAMDPTNASTVARVMIARWLAVCELDYG